MVYDLSPVRLSPRVAYLVRAWLGPRPVDQTRRPLEYVFEHKRDVMAYQMRVVHAGGLLAGVLKISRPRSWYDSLDCFDTYGSAKSPPLIHGASPVYSVAR